MRNLSISALFKNLKKPEHIGRDIGVGAFQRIADTRLGRKVNNAIEITSIEELIHCLWIGESDPHELEVTTSLQESKPRLFKSDVIVLVYGVEPDNFVTVGQKSSSNMKADKTGCSCHEYSHRCSRLEKLA